MAKEPDPPRKLRLPSPAAERQLEELQEDLRFQVIEYPVETCVTKLESTPPEFFIPEYQRNMVWNDEQKSKFVESVLLGLPVPFVFGVSEKSKDDRIAIIDGRQRLGTLQQFVRDGFALTQLEKLDEFEGLRFEDLSELQQRRFKRRGIRVVVLDSADASTQFDMFERLNTTGRNPTRADIRRAAYPGRFTDLIKRLATDPTFVTLTPMNESLVDQREREELVLRLFALANGYQSFRHSVKGFLDSYIREQNETAEADVTLLQRHETEFQRVCSFAKGNLPDGTFARGERNQTPRVRFEALAVGIALALRKRPEITKADMHWVNDDKDKFVELTRTDASNSRPKLALRVEYARDKILESAT